MKRYWILFLLATLLLSACAGAARSEANAPETALGEPLIAYHREAGQIAAPEEWRFYQGGQALRPNSPAAAVEVDAVTAVLEQAEAVGFFDWKDAYGASLDCADCYHYTLTLTYNGRTKTVTVTEGLKDEPPAFWDLLRSVRALADQAQ